MTVYPIKAFYTAVNKTIEERSDSLLPLKSEANEAIGWCDRMLIESVHDR
ncbi:MAG TPA: hypothetical protein V6D26_09965 [Stenomitos sp.]